ncbi:hypothetical protein M406DRAFT_263608 [Cryphonectria parasitica EP155]|uniref:Alpha/beta-hydrolase n=1 Tax=Cryphonectria parasitica (strain ATCC 38755 / EP155) TaxID=660469 RepID=A0A9P5CLX6_CRYP1|nr:uncharacterized protein M406DRAFT_263608 [Cryphonectria parasitica EP155]KAF3762677.1 hypothetical protein M406DRAFT_263608 [Cryphonectria parasitica EP155]
MFSSLTNITDFASAFHKGTKHFFTSRTLGPGGSGIYGPASYLVHPTLPNHTIYTPHPSALAQDEKLPVLVWANGMGLAWGLMFGCFLREIASHGYVVIANGGPGDEGTWSGLGRLQQVDEGAMSHVDGSRIALAGQSKGAIDAYAAAAVLRAKAKAEGATDRVKTVGVFNSGLIFRPADKVEQVKGLTVPVFFFIGGPADLAHRNAEMDWDLLPGDLPAWMGNLDVGHMGTFYDEDEKGGTFGRAAVDWLDFVLKGDEGARKRMVEEYRHGGWKVRSQNL